jgi:hypothetical protein
MMMAWSIGTICMPAMTSGAGFAVCRFFIGLAEAPFFPGITLSKSNPTSLPFDEPQLIANSDIFMVHQRGESHAHGYLACGKHHLQHPFWFLGRWHLDKYGRRSRTSRVAVAASAYFLLPSWPHNTKWLTPEESEMAQYRSQVSNGGHDEQVGGTWDGVKEAAKDPFTWYVC